MKTTKPINFKVETAIVFFVLALTTAAVCGIIYVLHDSWVEPETKCFDTAVHSERYCRTQSDWGVIV